MTITSVAAFAAVAALLVAAPGPGRAILLSTVERRASLVGAVLGELLARRLDSPRGLSRGIGEVPPRGRWARRCGAEALWA